MGERMYKNTEAHTLIASAIVRAQEDADKHDKPVGVIFDLEWGTVMWRPVSARMPDMEFIKVVLPRCDDTRRAA